MAANFNKPVTSDLRADVLQYIRDYMAAQAKLFDGETLTAAPVNAIRYSAGNVRFEKWNGTSWDALALGYLPLAGGTLTGALTGTSANFTGGLTVGGSAVWHAGNLNPAAYLPLAGGALAGTLTSRDIVPDGNNTRSLGADGSRYALVHATAFSEAGVALSAKYAALGHTHDYLPLSGGALSGALSGTSANFSSSLTVGGVAVSLNGHAHSYLPLSGGTLTGPLQVTTIEVGNASDTTLARVGAGRVSVEGVELGYRKIPTLAFSGGNATADAVGKCYVTTGGVTFLAGPFQGGDAVSIYNNTTAAITITQGVGLTLRLAGSATTGNRTLAQRGFATVYFVSTSEAVVIGAGVT